MFRTRLRIGFAAFFAAAAAVLASCTSDENGGATPPPAATGGDVTTGATAGAVPTAGPTAAPTVLATAEGVAPSLSGVRIAVTSLRRDSAEVVTLHVTITNGGSKPMRYFDLSNTSGDYQLPSASGVTLVDPVGKLRYYPLRDTEKVCVCTPYMLGEALPAGAQTGATVSFPAPPAGVASVTVDWAGFAPAAGVPLS